jgi:hypothetical protein
MNHDAELQIRGLIAVAAPTEEQVLEILVGWERYFERLKVAPTEQLSEINAVMRARVRSGSISVVAPDITKELSRAGGTGKMER